MPALKKETQEENYNRYKDGIEKYFANCKVRNVNPSKAGLRKALKVSLQTIYDWKDASKNKDNKSREYFIRLKDLVYWAEEEVKIRCLEKAMSTPKGCVWYLERAFYHDYKIPDSDIINTQPIKIVLTNDGENKIV